MKQNILIVDDESSISIMLKDLFTHKGYNVITAQNANEATRKIEKQKPDLILLDVNMPELDGFTFCKQIRNHIDSPIIFLTAKTDESDKLTGLAIGGDDYIVKPFSTSELLARVEAHLRREKRKSLQNKVKFSDGLVIDYTQKIVFFRQAVPLVRKEYEIIEFLSLHPGQVFDKEQIYERIWGYDSIGNSSVVTEHIRRARAKLKKAGCNDPIDTVWGIGYRWKK